VFAGDYCHRLVFSMVLMGDQIGVEGVLRWDENRVEVTETLLQTTKLMSKVQSCTFDFISFNDNVRQDMYDLDKNLL
jgi:hypothetical protein